MPDNNKIPMQKQDPMQTSTLQDSMRQQLATNIVDSMARMGLDHTALGLQAEQEEGSHRCAARLKIQASVGWVDNVG